MKKRKAESGMRKAARQPQGLFRFPLSASRFPFLALVAASIALTACAPREIIYHAIGQEVPRYRDFPADFEPPVSNESDEKVGGFGGEGRELTQTPVVFIHGNTVNAGYWKPAREYFGKAGYHPNEIWGLGYGWNSVRAFDADDLSVATLDAFMTDLQKYLSRKSGREVRQFDIVAHSLGVTLVRQWMQQTNKYHWVRNFIAACGANHGAWTARPDTRGQNRVVNFELYPGSPWLEQLNRNGETPGPTRYMTLYDGSGHSDVFFPKPNQDGPALQGATNLAWNVVHHDNYDHMELPRKPETMAAMIKFFKQSREPLPNEEPPKLVREGDTLRADQPGAVLHCASGGAYPNARTASSPQVQLQPGVLSTCYARNPRTLLSSALSRHLAATAASAEPLTLSASPKAGIYENPVAITLSSSDPTAFIVYSTAGAAPDSGSPLYQKPVYVAGPLTLTAVAITADGRRSAPLKLNYDISLELIDARHALERQFNPDAPVKYLGERKKGN